MMTSMLRSAWLLLLLPLLFMPACDLVTVPPPARDSRPADHLVINEVFALPFTNPNQFSWIELYNPTGERIAGMNDWRLSVSTTFALAGRDTFLQRTFRLASFFTTVPDTLEPGHFLVLYSDSVSFYNHTNLGPGKGAATRFFVALPPDRTELVLRDTAGRAVDVVRYGNYVPTSPDPFPGNASAGVIPLWSSLSRYAGAYATGNTANDFYMESKPIPMWYSQLNHP